jgi:ankyrin repeat protein
MSMNQKLLQAAYRGELAKVQKLLSQGADIGFTDENGDDAIQWATRSGKITVIPTLIDAATKSRVKINSQDKWGSTALHTAAARDLRDIARALIKAYTDTHARIDIQDRNGFSALHLAASNDKAEITKMIIEASLAMGVKIDSQNKEGDTPLQIAIFCSSTTAALVLIEAYLKSGAKLDDQNKVGNTPLHEAASRNNTVLAQALIKALLETENQEDAKKEADASTLARPTILGLLMSGIRAFQASSLKTGSKIEIENQNGESPLHKAASCGSTRIVNLLLAYGACFDILNKWRETPQQYIDNRPYYPGTPQYKSVSNILAAVHKLFEYAEKESKVSLEQIITRLGPAINARSLQRNGNTALHVAILNQRVDVIKRLLAANANVNLKNNDKKTALDLMLISPNPSIQELGRLFQNLFDIKNMIADSFVSKSSKAKNTEGKVSQEQAGQEAETLASVSLETLKPLLNQINAILPTLTDIKLKNYICFELGMLLARRTQQVHYEGLMPIDAVQAYNLLSQVTAEDPARYALAQTMLDVLCFERHVHLVKGPHYPDDPFIAVAPSISKDRDKTSDEDLLERAMFYHRARSSPENPHKDTVPKLAAALIDPGRSIQGIPGFTHLSDLASLNRFFDAIESAQQQRKSMQQEVQDLAKQMAKLESELAGSGSPAIATETAATTETSESPEPLVFIGPKAMGSKAEALVPTTPTNILTTSP